MSDFVAEVAVRAKRFAPHSVLTYRVPPTLRPVLQAGMLVWVPLRRERVQGVILRLYPASERPSAHASFTLRPITEVGDPEICIPLHGLMLSQWLAEYYGASLWDGLALHMPPGSQREASSTLFATSQGLAIDIASLPQAERGVLFYVRQHGETTEDDLLERLNGSPATLRRAITLLHDQGLLARGSTLSRLQARPLYEHTARLHIPSPFDWDALAAKSPRQASALQALAERQSAAAVLQAAALTTSDEGAMQPISAAGVGVELLRALAAKGLLTLGQREVMRNPLDGQKVERDTPPELTLLQAKALGPIITAIDQQRPDVFLLHGVTGSGKTELYLRAIARALRHGKQAAVLVPEIALTAQLVRRFAARFGPAVAVLHSALALGERYDTWRRLRRGDAKIVVGSRSAIFAPLPQLGLIILDEEHDSSYKHEDGLRYHARDVAIKLGQLTKSPIVLGSATPALESFQAAQDGAYQLLDLPERVTARSDGRGSQAVALPPVTLVDMRVELHNGNLSMFSRALQTALQTTLAKEQQAILFLNRRGLASFVLCRDCGYVVGCAHCSSPLVVHLVGERKGPLPPGTLLRCHSCGYREIPPAQCPRCWSQRIRHFGAGTQRVVEEVEAFLPKARVIRWDRDVTTRKGAHEELLGRLLRHEVDIIVGTQMIAKGLDLPLVTLVGVVSADTGLNMPDFRASERAFQLLAQVAGRAGRRDLGGQVIVQSYTPEHYALQAAANHDYHGFFREEIAFRREVQYPPFNQLVRFVYTSTSPRTAEVAALNLASQIDQIIAERRLDAAVIGPAPAFMEKLRDRFRWHLLVRAANAHPVLDALGPLPGWVVDVDPQSLM